MNHDFKRIPVSVLMLTFNEELNLARNLPVLCNWADELIIIDSYSTDRTVSLAEECGARIFQHAFNGHAAQWSWALATIDFKNEWIFMHDPDHRVTQELQGELADVFCRAIPGDTNGFYIRRRNVFRGTWIRHGGYYPVYMLKIVRRGTVSFDEHEFDYRAYVKGSTRKLKHDIVEENVKEEEIGFWIEKHNRFARRQAEEEMFRAAHPGSWKVKPRLLGSPDQRTLWFKTRWYRLPLFLRPFLYFVYRYFVRLGFWDGKNGFIFHFLQAFWYRLLVDINLDELRRQPKSASDTALCADRGEDAAAS